MSAILVKQPVLTLKAGPAAMQHIRQQGLHPADVHCLPGAAGGPKALGILGLDTALFGDWLPRQPQPRSLIGASIGSWRFASACQTDPVAALKRLGQLYTAMRFAPSSSIDDITQRCAQMLDELIEGEQAHILGNPNYHLNILVNRSHGLLERDDRLGIGLALGAVVAGNLLSRQHLQRHLSRVVLHDPRQPPPMQLPENFASQSVVLDLQNLKPALMASASIPMVMHAVREIPGLPAGSYRDGGLIDYHLDLPWQVPGIVLYPHFTDRIIPGWFDKTLRWRKPSAAGSDQVLLLSPSPEYLASLPYGKLPDRRDFKRFANDDTARERYWQHAMDASQRLGDEFLELVERQSLPDRLQPL